MVENLTDLWQLVSPRRITKRLTLEAQELCSEPTLTVDLAEQLIKAAKSMLEKEVVGSLPNEIVMQGLSTLDVAVERHSSELVQECLAEKKDLPITLALITIAARELDGSQKPTLNEEVIPTKDTMDAEASLVKPFPETQPRESWEFCEDAFGSRRWRFSRRRRQLLQLESDRPEEQESESETEKLFTGVQKELKHTLQKARCLIKAKHFAGKRYAGVDSSSSEPEARSSGNRQKANKKGVKLKGLKRARNVTNQSDAIQGNEPRRKLVRAGSEVQALECAGLLERRGPDADLLEAPKHDQELAKQGSRFGVASNATATERCSKTSKPSKEQDVNEQNPSLDALMQERNRLDAEILRRLNAMRSQVTEQ